MNGSGKIGGIFPCFRQKNFDEFSCIAVQKYGKMHRHVRTNDHRRRTKWRERSKYYIVAANALPEIFVKVAEAKRMMQTGEADTVGAATEDGGHQPQRVLQV